MSLGGPGKWLKTQGNRPEKLEDCTTGLLAMTGFFYILSARRPAGTAVLLVTAMGAQERAMPSTLRTTPVI